MAEITEEAVRERLLRGGLAPDTVERAMEAWEAGDILSLAFDVSEDSFTVPVPETLLRTVFPIPDAIGAELLRGMYVAYRINRHRGGRKSLTLYWPDDANGAGFDDEPDPELDLDQTERTSATAT